MNALNVSYDEVALICLVAWLVLLLPVVFYLVITWTTRRKALLDRFSNPDVIRLYYKQFFPCRAIEDDLSKQFERDLLPLLLLATISFIGFGMTAGSLQSWLGWNSSAKALPPIARSAHFSEPTRGSYTISLPGSERATLPRTTSTVAFTAF